MRRGPAVFVTIKWSMQGAMGRRRPVLIGDSEGKVFTLVIDKFWLTVIARVGVGSNQSNKRKGVDLGGQPRRRRKKPPKVAAAWTSYHQNIVSGDNCSGAIGGVGQGSIFACEVVIVVTVPWPEASQNGGSV